MAQLNAEAEAGALFPMPYSIGFGTLAVGTHTFRIKPDQAGRLRYVSACATFPNTMTIDIQKGGSSMLAGAKSLTTNTTLRLEGFGSDTSGAEQNFDTDTAAKRAELDYEDTDELSVILVVATGAATAGLVVLVCDERQPAVVV
jgi:hypothetical protein